MTIASLANYNTAKKQIAETINVNNVTTAAAGVGSCWPGTLAGTNAANGVIPTETNVTLNTALIDAFGASATGYLTKAVFNDHGATGASTDGILFDMVFKAGAYSFNSNVTLTSQPSYASRMPGGTDFTNTEIWFECVTAFTGNLTLTVTYTNQDGVTGRSTGSFAPGVAPILKRMFRLPLQAGDTGVQKIESVVSTVSTVGTFNILVLRRLAMARCTANSASVEGSQYSGGMMLDIIKLGMPQIFDTTCFFHIGQTDSTATGQGYWQLEVSSG